MVATHQTNTVDYWRQLDIMDPSKLDFPITLIGAGGIGSPVAFTLAKMGCSNLTVFDHDCVETHNLPNQMYRLRDVGKPKVEALQQIIADFTGVRIDAKFERYDSQPLKGVVICTVDTMKTRQDIWASVEGRMAVTLFVDCRMGGEEARVYAFNPTLPSARQGYAASLYSDESAVSLACTAQAIIYCPMVVAGIVAKLVQRYATNQAVLDAGIVTIPTFG